MSKRKGWWYHTRDVIQAYPDRRAKLNQIQTPALRPGGGRKGGAGRNTEQLALRSLPPVEQRELEAVEAAMRIIGQLADGADRLRIIELVHWKRTHTLTGAAETVHVSQSTAKRWQREMFLLVARACGFLDETE